MPPKTPPPVIYPSRGTPPDAEGYPHYATLEKANKRFKTSYAKLQAERRRQRQALLESKSSSWRRHIREVRESFARCLGLTITRTVPKFSADPRLIMSLSDVSLPTPELKQRLNCGWYTIKGAAWDGGDVELFILFPRSVPGPKPAVLLIPDSGVSLTGAQSPESAARGLGWELATAGFIVVIPKLPGIENISSTRNKRRLLEGSCTLGEVVGEAARALDWMQKQDYINIGKICAAGTGLGGLAAILLSALDTRISAVLADAPLRWGTADDHITLTVPRSHPVTDMEELCASLSPRPLAFIAPRKEAHPYDAVAANVANLQRAAQPAYAQQKARAKLAVFSNGSWSKAVAWLKTQAATLKGKHGSDVIVRAPKVYRHYNVTKFNKPAAWRTAAKKLRSHYRVWMGIPYCSPQSVKLISEKTLPDYVRQEYHVRTGEHSWANIAFLSPRTPSTPRPTILYLPGSGSDVAKEERQHAHEVIAEGWNACIMDARAALYPFHSGIAEGTAIIAQSICDLLCCLDWVLLRPDVDTRCVAAMGLSQGGSHSWMTAAMDDRIACAMSCCGLSTFQTSIDGVMSERYGGAYMSFLDSGTIYYCTPGVLELGDQQDLCGLIAPRPFMFCGADRDYCFNLDGMRACARDVAHAYRLLGAEENFEYVEFQGEHSMPEYIRRTAYAFFRRHFNRIVNAQKT